MKIPIKFRQYTENDVLIEEYTKDYVIDKQTDTAVFPDSPIISSKIETFPSESKVIEEIPLPPTIEEKILAENQYQTMLLELNTLGGA